MNPKSKVNVFFYGTFMNAKVLSANQVSYTNTRSAQLDNYRLTISPRVNVEPTDNSVVYGGLAVISHHDIQKLYQGLYIKFGIRYNPYPVNVKTSDSRNVPALCYMSDTKESGAADPDYLDEMILCATMISAPQDYLEHIESFR